MPIMQWERNEKPIRRESGKTNPIWTLSKVWNKIRNILNECLDESCGVPEPRLGPGPGHGLPLDFPKGYFGESEVDSPEKEKLRSPPESPWELPFSDFSLCEGFPFTCTPSLHPTSTCEVKMYELWCRDDHKCVRSLFPPLILLQLNKNSVISVWDGLQDLINVVMTGRWRLNYSKVLKMHTWPQWVFYPMGERQVLWRCSVSS